MKTILTLFCVCVLITNSNGQNISRMNEFENLTDLTGITWTKAKHLYAGSIVQESHTNGFSYWFTLKFIDNKRIQLEYSTHYPSSGYHNSKIDGKYKVVGKNEISIVFTKPTDIKMYEGRKQIQVPLQAIYNLRSFELPQIDLSELPQIKLYNFKISEIVEDSIMTEVTLITENGTKYLMGNYEFQTDKERIAFHFQNTSSKISIKYNSQEGKPKD